MIIIPIIFLSAAASHWSTPLSTSLLRTIQLSSNRRAFIFSTRTLINVANHHGWSSGCDNDGNLPRRRPRAPWRSSQLWKVHRTSLARPGQVFLNIIATIIITKLKLIFKKVCLPCLPPHHPHQNHNDKDKNNNDAHKKVCLPNFPELHLHLHRRCWLVLLLKLCPRFHLETPSYILFSCPEQLNIGDLVTHSLTQGTFTFDI